MTAEPAENAEELLKKTSPESGDSRLVDYEKGRLDQRLVPITNNARLGILDLEVG